MFFGPLKRPSLMSLAGKGRNIVLSFQTLQAAVPAANGTFQKGDGVFLAKGTYQGTIGTFLRLKDDDPKWADILEQNSQVRSHPVEWLQRSSQN